MSNPENRLFAYILPGILKNSLKRPAVGRAREREEVRWRLAVGVRRAGAAQQDDLDEREVEVLGQFRQPEFDLRVVGVRAVEKTCGRIRGVFSSSALTHSS